MGLSGTQTPRGPARWERARKNAERNPESSHAKLYRSRLAVADEAEKALELLGVPDSSFDWLKFSWSTRHDEVQQGKVEFRTCSVSCTAMQMCLEHALAAEIPTIITDALDGIPWEFKTASYTHVRLRVRDPQKQTRDVRCMVCGKNIELANTPPRTIVLPAKKEPMSQLELQLATAHSLISELRRDLGASLKRQDEITRERDAHARVAEELARQANHMIDTATLNDLFYLASDGYFVQALDMPVVQFDDEDRLQLLQDYGTAETRSRYLNDHGGLLRRVF